MYRDTLFFQRKCKINILFAKFELLMDEKVLLF